MSITITNLEVENVKRVKAVSVAPSPTGLTVIGGKNGQGKTSVLDAIAWALGGEKFRPTDAARADSVIPPHITINLSNGLRVERSGKNSSLKVLDPSGKASGQTLLNSFVSQFALNLPGFMQLSSKEKAQELLRICGIGDALIKLDMDEKAAYNERLTIGRIAEQKAKAAAEMPHYEGVPADLISASDLISRQQNILKRNAENARLRAEAESLAQQLAAKNALQASLEEQLRALQQETALLNAKVNKARYEASDLTDESTAELEAELQIVEDTNRKVRANLDWEKTNDEAGALGKQYGDLTVKIEDIRKEKLKLLEGANLPLEGLSVENGELTYRGHAWDCMSGAEQLRVATAIVRAMNPKCGFVLLDKLEQMDTDTLAEFGDWLKAEGLQAIATRVSTGGECSIIIEDGMATIPEDKPADAVPKRAWTPGQF